MKRNALIRIILWSIVIVLLTTLMMCMRLRVSFNRGRNDAGEPIEATVPLEETIAPYDIVSSDGRNTFPAASVRELDIEWVAGDIRICPGSTDRITVSEDGDSSGRYTTVIRLDEDSLEIRFSDRDINLIGLSNIPEKDLTVTVPADWYCRTLEIEAASATVEVCDLNIGKVDFEGASGRCAFENCTVREMDIDTASGDVRFTGELDILDCDAASASVYAVVRSVPSRLDMDTMSGDLELYLPENAGFTLSADTMSGDFDTDFAVTQKDGRIVSGDGACRIRVSALSGDVTIQKAQ